MDNQSGNATQGAYPVKSEQTMSHNTKLWLLVAVLAIAWMFVFVIKPLWAQGVPPWSPAGPPSIYGRNPETYWGRGFERGYRDYRLDGYRNWAPTARSYPQPYHPPYAPYQGRPYIGHWPSYGGW